MSDSEGLSRQESSYSAFSEEPSQPMSECESEDESAGESGDETMVPAVASGAGAEDAMEEDDRVEVLSPKELIQTQLDAIADVNSVFQIPAGTARILLEHFGWNKERLLERYYDGDQDRLFAEAHVVNPFDPQAAAKKRPAETTCEICYTDFPTSELKALPCEHPFCSGCWGDYLREKILHQGTAHISCPAFGCDILVDEFTVTQILDKEGELLKKYHYLAAQQFVGGNPRVRWCPAPGCENAVRVPHAAMRTVTCKCGKEFCFACGNDGHQPIICDMFKIWLKKCADDSETSNWIAANTKECPKCRTTIEKNGGCNHITCRQAKCAYEFCWVCLGPWEPHGSSWYNCNRFQEEDAKAARDAQDKYRDSLQRYLFFFNRYMIHEQSRTLESKLWRLVEKKQQEMQASGLSWIEVQFMGNAVRALSAARSTLKFTYVFAYYLQKNNQAEIFLQNQKDLEMATEKLSKYLEGDASGDVLSDMRQKVMDLTKYCEHRRRVMVEHVQEGYEHGGWEYVTESVQEMMDKHRP